MAPTSVSGKSLAVVGAGWAGLCAAVRAVERGWRPTVFEMAPQVGGRARSLVVDGIELDNGQHIMVGAYARTLALMRDLGVKESEALTRLPLELRFADGRGLSLRGGHPGLDLLRAIALAKGWTLRDRACLLATAWQWRRAGFRCEPDLTVDALCAGLTAAVRALLIDPLCVAALNTPAARASAQVLLAVLQDALFGPPGSADLLLPRKPLQAVLPQPAAQWLRARGCELRLGARVHAIDAGPNGQWNVDGAPFSAVVLACSAVEAARLAEAWAPPWSARTRRLRHEPIATVYLRWPSARLPRPMIALHEGPAEPAQFAFDRGALDGPAGLLAFVVSGAADWANRGADALRVAVRRQALRALPFLATLGPPVLERVVVERRATFRCEPGIERPGHEIAPGLVAAGDYTESRYPATIEAAVRSGEAAITALGSSA